MRSEWWSQNPLPFGLTDHDRIKGDATNLARVAVLFSGGIDSTIVAYLAHKWVLIVVILSEIESNVTCQTSSSRRTDRSSQRSI